MATKKRKAKAQAAPMVPAGASVSAAAPTMPESPMRPLVVDERLLSGALALVGVGGFLWLVREVLVALLFVCVLTFLGAPFVERLARRGVPRAAGAGLFLLGAGLFVGGLVALVAPKLVSDLTALFTRTPELLRGAAAWIETRTGVALPQSLGALSGAASKELLDQLSPFAAKGGALVGQGALNLARGAATVVGALGRVLLVPIITFFVLSELPEVLRVIVDVSPARLHPVGRRYAPLLYDALSGLVRGQLTVAALMAVAYAIGLGIAGVPIALAIAVLAGAAYLIPFASATVAFSLAAAFSLLERGADAGPPILGALVTCVLVQLLEGYVLTPRIVGEKAGLSPLAALLAVLLGGSAAGFLGVLFALPVGAIAAVLLREEVRRHRAPVLVPAPVEATA